MQNLIINSGEDFFIMQSKSLFIVDTNEVFNFSQRQYVKISFANSDSEDLILHSFYYQYATCVDNLNDLDCHFRYRYVFKKSSFDELLDPSFSIIKNVLS